MKTKLTFISLAILVFAGSCDNNSVSRKAYSVETYIELLRSNQYDSMLLPVFTYNDIPALLAYRNETQQITNFPQNLISSYHMSQCSLGIYVLWTIESIRAVSINSKSVIMGFPSQNPILALRNSGRLEMVSDITSHQVAAEAYYNWWKNSEHQDFNTFKNIDPLLGTNYRWH